MAVILKGELHVSPYDQQEAKDLLHEENPDVLLLEGKQGQGFEWDSWLSVPLLLAYPVIQLIYMDHTWLEELAEANNIQVERTRESDNSLWSNANWPSKTLAFTSSAALLPFGILLGTGGLITRGFSSTVLGVVLPIVILRYSNMLFNEEGNPDERIASKIKEHENRGQEILAVVGNIHLRGIVQQLDELKVSCETYPSIHKWSSARPNSWVAWKMLSSLSGAYLIFWGGTSLIARIFL
jgi:hypothetical protein